MNEKPEAEKPEAEKPEAEKPKPEKPSKEGGGTDKIELLLMLLIILFMGSALLVQYQKPPGQYAG